MIGHSDFRIFYNWVHLTYIGIYKYVHTYIYVGTHICVHTWREREKGSKGREEGKEAEDYTLKCSQVESEI